MTQDSDSNHFKDKDIERSKSLQIDQLMTIDAEFTSWNHDTLIFSVAGGEAALKWRIEIISEPHKKDDITYIHPVEHTLYLHQAPLCLVETHFPTCERWLSTGYGLEAGIPQMAQSVESAQEPQKSLQESLEALTPLLGLLDDGIYALTRVNTYPTAGDEDFFWLKAHKNGYVRGAGCGWSDEHMRYIYPSQSMSHYDPDHTRALIKAGGPYTGLAYYMSGGLGMLLDGHHRATAAGYHGEMVNTLVISDIARIGDTELLGGVVTLPKDHQDYDLFFDCVERMQRSPTLVERDLHHEALEIDEEDLSLTLLYDPVILERLKIYAESYPRFGAEAYSGTVHDVNVLKEEVEQLLVKVKDEMTKNIKSSSSSVLESLLNALFYHDREACLPALLRYLEFYSESPRRTTSRPRHEILSLLFLYPIEELQEPLKRYLSTSIDGELSCRIRQYLKNQQSMWSL